MSYASYLLHDDDLSCTYMHIYSRLELEQGGIRSSSAQQTSMHGFDTLGLYIGAIDGRAGFGHPSTKRVWEKMTPYVLDRSATHENGVL